MANEYDVGDRVRVAISFKNDQGNPADPTTVTGKYKDPSGNVTTASVSNPTVGEYHFDIDVDESGEWRYRAEGTGTVVAAGEGRLVVRASAFAAP